MKLATFEVPAGHHLGIVELDEIVDLTAADPSLATMIDLLEQGPHDAQYPPTPRRRRACRCQA